MTRTDWWLGVGVIVLALVIQTLVLLSATARQEAPRAKARPLIASVAGIGDDRQEFYPPGIAALR
jgi:hypothetical protein